MGKINQTEVSLSLRKCIEFIGKRRDWEKEEEDREREREKKDIICDKTVKEKATEEGERDRKTEKETEGKGR